MTYKPRYYTKLLGTPGFSDTLLKNHFTLYEGYVTNTAKLIDALDKLAKDDKAATPEYAEMKRRLGWEFNGMRLHELYFENLGGAKPLASRSSLAKKMAADFGSYEAWEKDFKATGAMRGIGWTVLYMDSLGDRLFNMWINEHDTAHLAGCIPVLIMDCFEHAYLTDYGLKRADYIKSFFAAVEWEIAAGRYERATAF